MAQAAFLHGAGRGRGADPLKPFPRPRLRHRGGRGLRRALLSLPPAAVAERAPAAVLSDLLRRAADLPAQVPARVARVRRALFHHPRGHAPYRPVGDLLRLLPRPHRPLHGRLRRVRAAGLLPRALLPPDAAAGSDAGGRGLGAAGGAVFLHRRQKLRLDKRAGAALSRQ